MHVPQGQPSPHPQLVPPFSKVPLLRLCPHLVALCSFLFHYAVGGQMARFVRLQTKLQHGSAPSFLAGFVLSSTVLWQALDALM